jgi:hypothetical protein
VTRKSGVFGKHDCMGRVRSWDFDAVVGIGGKRPWPKHAEIANKINWIGLNARTEKSHKRNWGGPLVRFDKFILYDGKGPMLREVAPRLYAYMFDKKHVRAVLSQSLAVDIQREVAKILRLAQDHKRTVLSETVSLGKKCCGKKRTHHEKSKC